MVKQVLHQYLQQWEKIYIECGREPSRTRREMKARWVSRFVSGVGIIDDPRTGWKRVTFIKDGRAGHGSAAYDGDLEEAGVGDLDQGFPRTALHKRSEIMIKRLWDSFKVQETGRLIIPPDWIESYEQHKDKWPWERMVADYIAGMTDAYAEKVYAEFFASRSGSIYERD